MSDSSSSSDAFESLSKLTRALYADENGNFKGTSTAARYFEAIQVVYYQEILSDNTETARVDEFINLITSSPPLWGLATSAIPQLLQQDIETQESANEAVTRVHRLTTKLRSGTLHTRTRLASSSRIHDREHEGMLERLCLSAESHLTATIKHFKLPEDTPQMQDLITAFHTLSQRGKDLTKPVPKKTEMAEQVYPMKSFALPKWPDWRHKRTAVALHPMDAASPVHARVDGLPNFGNTSHGNVLFVVFSNCRLLKRGIGRLSVPATYPHATTLVSAVRRVLSAMSTHAGTKEGALEDFWAMLTGQNPSQPPSNQTQEAQPVSLERQDPHELLLRLESTLIKEVLRASLGCDIVMRIECANCETVWEELHVPDQLGIMLHVPIQANEVSLNDCFEYSDLTEDSRVSGQTCTACRHADTSKVRYLRPNGDLLIVFRQLAWQTEGIETDVQIVLPAAPFTLQASADSDPPHGPNQSFLINTIVYFETLPVAGGMTTVHYSAARRQGTTTKWTVVDDHSVLNDVEWNDLPTRPTFMISCTWAPR